MKKIGIVYGSTTGTCEDLAGRLAAELGVDDADVINAGDMDESVEDYDVLVLGTSTWGEGELQDDWYDAIEILADLDLSGKTVVLFGCGDSMSYSDTFCSAMRELYDVAKEAGATVLPGISTEGYNFSDSEAVIDNKFVGYAFDEMNEPDLTDERMDEMVEAIKAL